MSKYCLCGFLILVLFNAILGFIVYGIAKHVISESQNPCVYYILPDESPNESPEYFYPEDESQEYEEDTFIKI
jgi:hypothetical protein